MTQFDHTVGANSFFVRLKRDVHAASDRLLRWLNASEASRQFTRFGQRRWLRPDGYAEIELGGKIRRLFLEWDRGTTRWPDVTEKFQSYSDYFAVQPPEELRADVLVVTNSPHREAVIWKMLKCLFRGETTPRVLTSIDTLLERLGCLAPIWRSSDSMHRLSWPTAQSPAELDTSTPVPIEPDLAEDGST